MQKGELFLLTSPSGTGKDTLIDRVLEGPVQTTEGKPADADEPA